MKQREFLGLTRWFQSLMLMRHQAPIGNEHGTGLAVPGIIRRFVKTGILVEHTKSAHWAKIPIEYLTTSAKDLKIGDYTSVFLVHHTDCWMKGKTLLADYATFMLNHDGNVPRKNMFGGISDKARQVLEDHSNDLALVTENGQSYLFEQIGGGLVKRKVTVKNVGRLWDGHIFSHNLGDIVVLPYQKENGIKVCGYTRNAKGAGPSQKRAKPLVIGRVKV